jgi:hypothetical protein
MPRRGLHDLSKHRLASVHRLLPVVTGKIAEGGMRNSNR